MSLLDSRQHQVTLYPEKVTTDSVGNPGQRVPDMDAGVVVYGLLQPVSSSESNANGQQVRTQWRFITRDFPAGAFAAAAIPGRGIWDVVGEPTIRSDSGAVSHATVVLQARTAKAVN